VRIAVWPVVIDKRRLHWAIVFAPAFIVALLGAATFYGIRRERISSEHLENTSRAIDAYNQLLADLHDAQNAQRGFIITGDQTYLAPYVAARSRLDADRDRLKQYAAIAGEERAQSRQLDSIVVQAFQIYARRIELRRTQGEAVAAADLATGRGELLAAHARAMVAQAVSRAQGKQQVAEQEREQRALLMSVAVPAGTLFVMLLALLVNESLVRDALREQAQTSWFRAIIENAYDLTFVTDANARLVFVSPSVERVLGYRPNELVGSVGTLMVHPDDLENTKSFRARAIANPRTSFNFTNRVRTKDGGWRTLHLSITSLLDDPHIRGVITNARDVTESQKLQDQLLQSQKMDAVGRLAGGIAHDFNNLITTIKGYLTFALDDKTVSESVRADLQEVDQAADRAAELTKQLLAFSRHQPMEARTVDVNDVVADFQRMIQRVIGETIMVRARLADEPQFVLADPGQLHQVLMNLTVNARDAMPDGGIVTIEVRCERRDTPWPGESTMEPGDYAMIAVSDTGEGMSAEVRARIFDPFFTTKPTGSGTGLGLSVVYGIVKQNGGHVYVYSEPGHGTTFKIYLPLATPISASAENDDAVDDRPGTETILVVEDQQAVRAIAVRALRSRGYQVLEAHNGIEALGTLHAHAGIKLILSDLVMPEMRGQELYDIVRRDYPDIRFIMMSGYTDSSATELPEGAAYIEKPFTIAALARKVRSVLDAHYQLQA
jgi:two-component system, cell cycle sensor histidine kinase and response regulator CckA